MSRKSHKTKSRKAEQVKGPGPRTENGRLPTESYGDLPWRLTTHIVYSPFPARKPGEEPKKEIFDQETLYQSGEIALLAFQRSSEAPLEVVKAVKLEEKVKGKWITRKEWSREAQRRKAR